MPTSEKRIFNINLGFLKDVGFVTSSKLIGVIIRFLLRILVLRLLTKEDFGVISTLSAFVVYFDLLSDFSTHPIANREMVSDRENSTKTYFTYYSTKIIMSFFSSGLFLILAYFMGYFRFENAVWFIAFNILFNSLANAPDIVWQTNSKFKRLAIANLSSVILTTSASALIITYFQSYIAYFIAMVCASVVTFTIKSLMVLKETNERFKFSYFQFDKISALLKESLPLAIGSLLYLLCYRIDVIVLEKLGTLSQVADYNAAFSVLDQIVDVVWMQFLVVFYPKMIEIYNDNPPNLLRKIHFLCLALIPISLITMVCSYFISPLIFTWVFGAKYAISGKIITYLLPAQLFLVLFSLFYRATIILKKTTFFPIVSGIAAVINLSLNIKLIPIYGINGAIITTCVTSFFLALVCYFYLLKQFKNCTS